MSIVTSSRWQAKEYTKPWAISKLPAHFFPTRIKHEANSCTRYLRRSLATVLGCPKALVSDQIDSSPRFVYTQCSILHFITPLLPTSLPLCCVKVYKTDATGQSHLIRRLQQGSASHRGTVSPKLLAAGTEGLSKKRKGNTRNHQPSHSMKEDEQWSSWAECSWRSALNKTCSSVVCNRACVAVNQLNET